MWRGEVSPSYLWHVEVPGRIYNKVPAARINILLRDPIERAYSQYLMDRIDGYGENSFYAAVQEQLAQPDRVCYGTGSGYVQLGEYSTMVKRYLDWFGPDQVLVLLFDDLVYLPRQTMKKVAAFLDIDSEAAEQVPSLGTVYMAYQAPRTEFVQRLMQLRRLRLLWRAAIPLQLRPIIRRNWLATPAPKPPRDSRAAALLQPIYEPQLAALEHLLGQSPPELRRTWHATNA